MWNRRCRNHQQALLLGEVQYKPSSIRFIVDEGLGTGNENIPFAMLWKDGYRRPNFFSFFFLAVV
jgi:hypothetical protein